MYITTIEDLKNKIANLREASGDELDETVPANLDDMTEVENNKKDYFFSNILFFTNERDSSSNKTLKNLEDAVKGKNVNIITFVADEVDYKATDKKISIHDSQNKYTIDKQSNVDTIVIVRLGAQDSEECIELI